VQPGTGSYRRPGPTSGYVGNSRGLEPSLNHGWPARFAFGPSSTPHHDDCNCENRDAHCREPRVRARLDCPKYEAIGLTCTQFHRSAAPAPRNDRFDEPAVPDILERAGREHDEVGHGARFQDADRVGPE
jgi:hypothetical protein